MREFLQSSEHNDLFDGFLYSFSEALFLFAIQTFLSIHIKFRNIEFSEMFV